MNLLTRFKSDEKLQAEALNILSELIRRDLLRINVRISNIPMVLDCLPAEAYITGSRSATVEEVFRSHMTGVLSEKKGGPGITISLRREFRLASEKEEEQIRETLPATLGTGPRTEIMGGVDRSPPPDRRR